MNKRAIINVATGPFYTKMQERLINSFLKSVDRVIIIHEDRTADWETGLHTGIDLICWNNLFPQGSRPHTESQYGFKVHAFKYAYSKGYTSILWLDSPAYAVQKNVSPIFEVIEEKGYYAMSHIDPLINQVGDTYLKFYRMKREKLEGYNLPSGSCYGFDLRNPVGKGIGAQIFRTLEHDEFRGLFKTETSDEWNHRHDEACLAGTLKRMKLEVFTFDPLFQSDKEECVIKSGSKDEDD
jgi:hypothetical protein